MAVGRSLIGDYREILVIGDYVLSALGDKFFSGDFLVESRSYWIWGKEIKSICDPWTKGKTR